MGKYRVTTEGGTYIITTDDAPVQEPAAASPEPQGKSVGGFLSNIPQSAGNLVSPFIHPMETAKAMGSLAVGIPEALARGAAPGAFENIPESDRSKMAKVVGNTLVDRYRPSNIGDTLYEDPIGVAADVAGLLSGGGGLGAKAASAAGLAKTAGVMGKVSKTARASDPLALGGKALVSVRGPAAKAFQTVFGATTGQGAGYLKEAWASTGEFVRRMRGAGTMAEIVDDMRTCLSNMKLVRGNQYRAALDKIGKLGMKVDITPVYQTLRNELKNFNIQMKPAKGPKDKPTLDFSRSTIHAAEDQNRVRGIFDDILKWGTKPEDLTPLGVDTLKRRIEDFYSDSSQARAFVNSIGEATKKQLDTVPGYTDMTRDYAVASEMIRAMESELSLNKNTGTAVRKIARLFTQTNDYRETLVEALNKYSGGKRLQQKIAGEMASEWFPTGIMRPLTAGTMITGMGGAGIGLVNPAALLAVLGTSPRLVAETTVALGRASRGAKKIADTTHAGVVTNPLVYRPGYYAKEADKKKSK